MALTRTLSAVLGNSQKLDGGAMFGNAPRPLWERWIAPDERHRIPLACRAMLIEEHDGSKVRRILFEAGIGAFFAPKLRDRFGVVEERHVLLDELQKLGLSDADIDVVVLSHLHFDHAGGLLAAYVEGAPPKLLFPNARFVVGAEHFARANDPHSRDRASFIPELNALLSESGRLELVSGSESEVLGPEYKLHRSSGHTPGLMLVEVPSADGPIVFAADLIPGRPWVHLPITMGYDRFPEQLIDEKRSLLTELLGKNGRLFFTHDPEVAMSRVQRDEQGNSAPERAGQSLRGSPSKHGISTPQFFDQERAQMSTEETSRKKPDWLRVKLPGGERYQRLKETFRRLDLHTVCEEARCPNVGECWGEGTATIMILGETCTRGCRFCAVNTGDPGGVVDPREPENTGKALGELDLAYVVLTMVDRDDLLDGGAEHVARTVQRIRHYAPKMLVETLVGDFQGVRNDVRTLVRDGRPDVFAHNVEVVPSLQRKMRDARCSWQRSVDVLKWAKDEGANVTKSSLMVGCGETEKDMLEAMQSLRDAGVDVLTIGQYLRPTPKHAEVVRFVEPSEFDAFRDAGMAMGFRFVASGPLVRSSYRAAEAFLRGILNGVPSDASDLGGTPFEDRYGKKTRLSILR